jgi:hypothetical protein
VMPGRRLASAGLSVVCSAACSASNAPNLGRDNVETSYQEVVYSSTSAVNSWDRAHLGEVVIMHGAHIARVAAVGDSVVVGIHCSGSSSPALLKVTRPQRGQP